MSRNGEKFETFSTFLAHPIETPWPTMTVLHQNVRSTYATAVDNAEENITSLNFWPTL